jgi:RNA polymerase sigma-70 factor, ECF subfamily
VTAQSLCEARRAGRGPRREGGHEGTEPVILAVLDRRLNHTVSGVVREGSGLEDVTDEVLVQRVAESGDGRALSELYDRYGGLVYGAGMRYLGDRTLAEDLVQDVFVSVWRNAASYDPSKARFSTWVYRIARNRATDLARRRRTRPQAVAPSQGEETFPEPDDVEEILRAFDVNGGLSEISPAHREVLVLAYFRGLSQREISRHTGIPLGTVKSRTTAALRALRGQMLAAKTPNNPRKGVSKDRRTQDE